jgi:hypothetical protein
MADNVQITAGSGTTIATDDVGSGVQVQRVKMTWGVDGTATDASATNPLPVVAPGVLKIAVTPTISTSAYTSGDAIGGLLTFANAARVSGGGGVIQSVTIVDKDQERPPLDLVLFDQTFTNTADNAAFDPTDADLANVIGVVSINAWANFNDNAVGTAAGVNLPYDLTGTDLFGQLVVRAAPTYTATSDIIVILQVVQA